MPDLTAPDGVRLHWEERGSGPAILLAPYWSMHPDVFNGLEAALLPDFRVVRYDERGTGQSDRSGPYDIRTDISDLEAVCEAAGPIEMAVCLVDASNRAVRVADSRPDLLKTVFGVGSAPFGVDALSESDSLLSSAAVIKTFLQQLESDPRGAIRSGLAGANTTLTEDEVRERVNLQIEYAESDATATRAREWAEDRDAEEPGRRIGARLCVCMSETMGGSGSWFPSAKEMEPVVRDVFPDARITWAADGIVSAPHEVAGVIRGLIEEQAPATYDRGQ